MSAAATLLADLTGRGLELRAAGDRLRFRPASAMTPELAERVRALKGELLALLNPPLASEPTETHADREIRRFLSVCRPWPDARGWFDPTARSRADRALFQFYADERASGSRKGPTPQFELVNGVTVTKNPADDSASGGFGSGDTGDSAAHAPPGGRPTGVAKGPTPWTWAARRDPVTGETDVERAARYRRECGGLPPGARRLLTTKSGAHVDGANPSEEKHPTTECQT